MTRWRIIVFVAVAACVLACFCAIARWFQLGRSLRRSKEKDTDAFLRLLWLGAPMLPLAQILLTWRLRQQLRRWLDQAGHEGVASDVLAAWWLTQACGAAAVLMLILLCVAPSTSSSVMAIATSAIAILSIAMSCLGLRRQAARRRRQVLSDLPFLLDLATLCVEAGLNIVGALEQAAHYLPAGVLRQALVSALAEMRAGVPRATALAHMADRLDAAPIHRLVAALAQAQTLGMSVGPLLRTLADTQRNDALMRAEQSAQKAPVKLLFPLVTCIFPCTFIVLGFPLVAQVSAWSN